MSSNIEEMSRTISIGFIVFTIVVLLGLFYFRASQTIAYKQGKGQLQELDASKYTKEYLYKGRKPPVVRPPVPKPAPVAVDSVKKPAKPSPGSVN